MIELLLACPYLNEVIAGERRETEMLRERSRYGSKKRNKTIERKYPMTNLSKKAQAIIAKKEAEKEAQKKAVELALIIKKCENYNIKVGDLFVDTNYGSIYRLSEINHENHSSDMFEMERANDEFYTDGIESWGHYGSISLDRLMNDYARIESIEAYKNIEKTVFEKLINNGHPKTNPQELSSSTALITTDKNMLVASERMLMEKENEFKMIEAVLNNKRYELQEYVSNLRKTLKSVQKVLYTIELYMGIYEEVIQLRGGLKEGIDVPISLRQQLLFMDEEICIDYTGEGGLGWEEIGKFDNWLLTDNNYKKIIPEPKGIVALKVRRKNKDYDGDGFANAFASAFMNENNHKTYLLIRNGECLYRIFADIIIYPRLFPKRDEHQEIIDNLKNGEHVWDSDIEKMKQQTEDYKMHFLVIQGILDRTDLLTPTKSKINMFDESTYEGNVVFIRDEENLLPTGRKSWRDWHKEINSHLKIGSRVFLAKTIYRNKDNKDRFFYIGSEWSPSPGSGIYNIKRTEEEKSWHSDRTLSSFVCQFNPGDTIWTSSYFGYEEHTRKRSISFKLYASDPYVFNYDMITLDDIDFYLNDRTQREDYLEYINPLKALRKVKLREMQEEENFIALIKTKVESSNDEIRSAVEWWKMKVIEKRPLMKEDAKALRMIMQRLKKRD